MFLGHNKKTEVKDVTLIIADQKTNNRSNYQDIVYKSR